MEYTGRFLTIGKDLPTNKFVASMLVNEDISAAYEKMKGCDTLDIVIKKHRNRRSLDANAYLWVLLQKLADVVSTSGSRVDKWDMYLMELAKYGVFTHIVVKPEAVDRVKQEWRAVTELGEITVGSMTGIQLQCYYGSSTYNTAEMARLIDGVVTDCREMGIETLPPDEIDRIKREWGVEIEKAT